MKLSEITLRITKGTTPNSSAFGKNEVTYIKSESLNYNGIIDESKFTSIDNKTHTTKLKRSILKKNDILYSIAGMNLGKVGIVDEKYLPANTNQAVALISVNENYLIPKYLYYYLQQRSIINYVNSGVSQSAQPNINLAQIGDFEINLPSKQVQAKVVKILDDITNKIKMNNQINNDLQDLCNALYFDLIHKLNNNNSSIDSIGNIAKCILGGTPSRAKEEYWNGSINWINSGEINKFRIVEASEKITELGLNKSSTSLLPKNTTVLAITGATLGQVSRLEIETCANQSVIGIIPNNNRLNNYVYLSILNSINDLILKQTGGAQQHINKNDVETHEIIVPNSDLLNDFDEMIGPLFDQISVNCFENKRLEQLKESLLPKLMTGEIDLDNIEI